MYDCGFAKENHRFRFRTSFDGKDVDSWETLVNLMKYYQVGEQVEVVYSRLENGSFTEYTTTLTLTEKPQVSNK